MSKIVAVVDDEPDIVDLISLHLKRAGFRVEGFGEAKSFLRYLEKQVPDLVLLDIMLPDADGFELCQYLRRKEKWSSLPIIMVTAKTEKTNKIIGVEVGADDYVTKPLSAKELVARAKAVLRRRKPREPFRVTVGGRMIIDSEKAAPLIQNIRGVGYRLEE